MKLFSLSLSLSLIVLLSSISSSYAVLVTMPDAKILQERLSAHGFDHFMEKTRIVQQLAGQQKEALGVAMAVELALYDYCQSLPPMMQSLMTMRKPQLIEALLEGQSAAIQELKDNKLL